MQSKGTLSYCLLIFAFFGILFNSSCTKDDPKSGEGRGNVESVDTTYTIAVVMPFNKIEDLRLTIEWAQQNIRLAQSNMPRSVSLNIEYYDEEEEDINSLALSLRGRKDVMAIIGPLYSTNAAIMAKRCFGTKKTMIMPCVSSEELIRDYSGSDFFWTLMESDVSQCEVLLTRAFNMGAKSVSLLATNDLYGQTFVDWFAFQAQELGLSVGGIFTYDDNLDQAINKAFSSEEDVLICVPSDFHDVKQILRRTREAERVPYLLFSDMAFEPGLVSDDYDYSFAEGVTSCADPNSGFDIAYKVHFAKFPSLNSSQIYDALILCVIALTRIDCGLSSNMNDALKAVVSTTDDDGSALPTILAWYQDGLRTVLSGIRQGQRYNISGASGPLDFEKDYYTCVINSVYSHWMVYNRSIIFLNFFTSDGTRRTEPTLGSWSWIPSAMQEFSNTTSITYPPCDDKWALLVATSSTWKNYRHQADVLNMYQILRSNGYPDDHIVLIVEDDIANNSSNPDRGKVLRYDGENLYHDLDIDYHLSDLSVDDIERILTGQLSQRLPHVIRADANDNVLVYWSGHGEQGYFNWADNAESDCFDTQRLNHLLSEMQSRHAYRKMLWVIEACYSASVAIEAQAMQVPGVLMMTAAGPFESSKASQKIDGIYRSDRFSEVFAKTITNTPNVTYRDLYYTITTNSFGSHCMVFNESMFDNLYRTSPYEFFHY